MTPHVIDDFIGNLGTASTPEAARDVFSRTLEQFDLRAYAYLALRYRGTTLGPKPYFLTTYPKRWVEHYDSSGYLSIDPVMLTAPSLTTPLVWGTREHRRQVRGKQRDLMNEASQAGLCQGLAFPIHAAGGEFGLMSVASDGTPRQFSSLLRSHKHDLHVISLYYHGHVAANFIAPDQPAVSLTARERECLLWSAFGKSSWEVGQLLNVAESTVNFHMQNAMRKLEVYSRQHAVVKAVMMGLICP